MLASLSMGYAQVLMPVGAGLPHEPVKMTAYETGIAVMSVDANQEFVLSIWNGDFWYDAAKPPLPEAGSNNYGYLEIKDLKEINGKLYVVAEHTLDLMPTAPNFVLEWNGLQWKDISDSTLSEALVINELVYIQNKLQLIGKFSDGSSHYNVLTYNGSTWGVDGNLITRNIIDDKFTSVTNLQGKAYATGIFSQSSTTYTLVEWDGSLWKTTAYPAFINSNNTVGSFNDKLVVYGYNNLNEEAIKLQNGATWTVLSSGLENYSINSVESFCESDQNLFALGEFVASDQTSYSLMMYSGGTWEPIILNAQNIDQTTATSQSLFVGGTFTNDHRLQHVASLNLDRALIKAKVFHDKNKDCVKDANEEWLVNYPLHLNSSIDHLLSDSKGMLYAPAMKGNYNVNASSVSYYQPTCEDIDLNISEFKEYEIGAFGVAKLANIKDATVSISDKQSYFTGTAQRKKAMICVSNLGSEKITAASVELTHQADIVNFSSEIAYTSYQNGVANWLFDLEPESELCFYVEFDITSEIDVELLLEVDLSGEDADVNNNRSVLHYKKGEGNSNSKFCNNGALLEEEEEYLNYKISFKNEGYKVANSVTIVDVLDEQIVPGAKGLTYMHSHSCTTLPVEYEILPDGSWQYKFVWVFDSINLPNTSGEESEGFVDFKIYLSPGSLTLGDEICNTASIYYSYVDGTYEEPLKTNTVCSKVSDGSSVDTLPFVQKIEIGPNPSDGVFFAKNHSAEQVALKVVNAIGQEILYSAIDPYQQRTFDLANFGAGVYFIYVDGKFSQKMVIY